MGLVRLPPGESVWVERARIANFRSIALLELEFRSRLTLLIGENGAGKTTVLDAIAMVLGTRPERPIWGDADGRLVDQKRVGETRIDVSAWGEKPWLVFGGASGPLQLGLSKFGVPAPNMYINAYYGADRDYGSSFSELVEWFAAKDVEEARRIREIANLSYRDPELELVRSAVAAMIPGTSQLRIDPSTNQLVTNQRIGTRTETFEVGRLAGGLRAMLVLVADLARMIVAGPAGGSLSSRAVVLIDELDLHLHPRWQTDVVGNLLDAFPNVQFIVTTHSEEIIASVPSECVVSLDTGDDGVFARSIPDVQGATFDRVLEDAMGLPGRRPPEVQAMLDKYWKLIDGGLAESEQGKALRLELDELFKGGEPDLLRADLAIRRNRSRHAAG